ncbi:unnamed protein product [Miscanthus lutarioriparius]|uniref:Uncharacterized protein n=1 Tax=Miscanthus lutarioriparius TaxID=422564 RepID=A0A811Q4R4_9POAL|nr:unnamed protein product [Miscanthus lutarioriparius]
MKKASRYLKQLFSSIVAAVKARSTAVMGIKASSLRTRLIVLGITRNKKLLLSAIQSKIHAIMGGSSSHSSSNAVGASRGGGGGESERLFLASSGARKAALLQSLPSFAVEQEARAVVLLSSLPSFALERNAAACGGRQRGQGRGGSSSSRREASCYRGRRRRRRSCRVGGGGRVPAGGRDRPRGGRLHQAVPRADDAAEARVLQEVLRDAGEGRLNVYIPLALHANLNGSSNN